MARPEIARRFFGGRWRTDVENEGASNGGSVSDFDVVRVPISFDTADLTFPATGLTIYEPTPGDVILGMALSIPTTAWDGTTPTINTGPLGDLGHYLGGVGLGSVNGPTFSGDTSVFRGQYGPILTGGGGVEVLGSDPIMALIDDGAGGAPGSTEGEGELLVLIIRAAS